MASSCAFRGWQLMRRLIEILNHRVLLWILAFPLAMTSTGGGLGNVQLSWQAVATYATSGIVVLGGYAIHDRLEQQADRDRKQDETFQEQLRTQNEAHEKALSQIVTASSHNSDLIGSLSGRALELATIVTALQVNQKGLQDSVARQDAQREADLRHELDELRNKVRNGETEKGKRG